ncbi:MAG TPA: hypothetical protein VGA75_00740, partial [Paracoccaceae bacterium]
ATSEAAMAGRVVSLSDWVGSAEAEAAPTTVVAETTEIAPETSSPSMEWPEPAQGLSKDRPLETESGDTGIQGIAADEPAPPAPDMVAAHEISAAGALHGGITPDIITPDSPPPDGAEAVGPDSGDLGQLATDTGNAPETTESRPKEAIGKVADTPWLPALLRGLAPGALDDRQAALRPLHARIRALRDRMAEAGRAPRP